MTPLKTTLVTSVLLAAPIAVAAQPTVDDAEPTRQEQLQAEREAKRAELSGYTVSSGEQRLLWVERTGFPLSLFAGTRPGLRPIIGGMPSGSGFVVGAGYLAGNAASPAQLDTVARVSTYGFTTFETKLTGRALGTRVPVTPFVRADVRDLKALNFFGLGETSQRGDVATYRQEDRSVTAGVTGALTPILNLGADATYLRAEISPGTRRTPVPQRFDTGRLAGFGLETDYVRYGGHLELDLRDHELPAAGLWLRLDAARFDNQGNDALDFDRVVADVHGYVPLGTRNRMLAFRFRTSHSLTDGDDRVPFYLMETLGGARTIRGFREYRFRDARNMLLSAEYRWEVWTHVDFALFYDAGKAFARASSFDFQDLESGYGFGVRAHAFSDTMFRLDVARSQEGYRFHIGAGPSF